VRDVKSRATYTGVAGDSEEEPDRQHGRHSTNDEEVEIPRGGEITGEGGVFLVVGQFELGVRCDWLATL
jgi:hypothetical protein